MGRLDLVEPFAIRNLRKNVREAMQSHGEEVILLQMFHATTDEGTQGRCPNCYDDIYKASGQFSCDVCYGTTFEGGIKKMLRSWAIFTVNDGNELRRKRGEWQPDNRNVQLEASIDLMQNDYLVRVSKWSPDHRPVELSDRYVVGVVTDESLRTGNQVAQDDNDRVGQRCPVNMLKPEHVAYRIPIPMDSIPQAEDVLPPWVREPKWFYGEGPPTQFNTVGAEFGDKYLDIVSEKKYDLEPDNA